MVKGKSQIPPAKSSVLRRNAAKNTPVSSPASLVYKPCKSQDVPSCCSCGIIITEDTKALQCDRCTSVDAWKCAECLHLSDVMYNHLVSDSKVTLKWFCDSCDKAVMDKTSYPIGQKDKMDHLLTVIEKLMDRYACIEKSLESKCDLSEISQLEMRIKQLEDRLGAFGNELDSRLSSVEDHIKLKVTTAAAEKENVIPDEELIKCVIQDEINRKTEEERDLEKRKNNIIIYRVPEKKMENVTERRDSDMVFVKDMFDGVFNLKIDDGDIVKMYRLGRWDEGKARPLLVSLRDSEQKEIVMANLSNLRQPIEKFRGISIWHDLHPKEREERKRLVAEARQEHIANGSDEVENYRFLVVGHGQRRRVIKVKRGNTSA